jgi:hypothetical protein
LEKIISERTGAKMTLPEHFASEVIIELLKILPMTFVAGIVAYIAWQQHITSKQQLKAILRPPRLQVYESVKRFLVRIIQKHNVEDEDLRQFLVDTKEAPFAFHKNKGIKVLLDTIYVKAVNFQYLQKCLKNPNKFRKTREQILTEQNEEWDWLHEQNKSCDENFQKYLGFE